MVSRILLTLAFMLHLMGMSAFASVPPVINYQGKLMQPSGVAVPDGTYSMQFAIYDVPTGGTALWSETNPSVQVNGGLFAVLLGSVVNLPANIFDSPDRFFGVTVGADPEMTPRQQIASVGFAVKAGSADIAATVPDGAITTEKIADGAVTTEKLVIGIENPAGTISMFGGSAAPPGWLLCDGTAVSRTSYAGLFAAIGITFGSGNGETTFNLPDFRGVYPKGAGATDRANGKDASGNFYAGTLGVYSNDRMQGHYHNSSVAMTATPGPDQWCLGTTGSASSMVVYTNYGDWRVMSPRSDGVNGTPRTGKTTEPQSLGTNFIIKY